MGIDNKKITVCYFGIHNPDFSRNKVFKKGLLENGVEVIDCVDNSVGLSKFLKLFSKHKNIKNQYDAMIVGYPGHIIVPFARILSSKPLIFDALCTMWESETFSHGASFLKQLKMKITDWLAVKCADIVLVESSAQKRFFEERFGGRADKYQIVYTGVDESPYQSSEKLSNFTVLFRGRLTPEAGVKYILEATNILRDQNIFFRIIGFGILEEEIKRMIIELKLEKVELISKELEFNELRQKMSECHISLGQFENNPRLSRTIPHKAFEALFLKLPYITARVSGISDLFVDGENCLLVNQADAADLAKKISFAKDHPEILSRIANNGYRTYQEEFSSQVLGLKIKKLLVDLL